MPPELKFGLEPTGAGSCSVSAAEGVIGEDRVLHIFGRVFVIVSVFRRDLTKIPSDQPSSGGNKIK